MARSPTHRNGTRRARPRRSASTGVTRVRYVECDGQVYLVRRRGRWTFPKEDDPLPFEVVERHSALIGAVEVVYCRPRLAGFPADWIFKDDVPGRTDVDPLVHQAINASLSRLVVGVLATRSDGRILMVKSNRGFTKGMWNVPGGFLDYGEHPEEAARREVLEETGVEVRLGELLGVFKERFASPYFMYGFMYAGTPRSERIRLDPTEIEAYEWMEPERAYRETRNPFARAAMRRRFGFPAPAGTARVRN